MGETRYRHLTQNQIDAFARELDQIKADVLNTLGERDARYIRRVYAAVRYTGLAGRTLLLAGWLPPFWLLGTTLLATSKILENMEVGHNVIHGQYDWMNDPNFDGDSYEWDTVGTSKNWRYTHNFRHHTYTNVQHMDHDIGYDIIRIFPEQDWHPVHLLQPFYSALLCLYFQWGVGIQPVQFDKAFKSKADLLKSIEIATPIVRKALRNNLKEYVFYPLLAGPSALPVLTGNLAASGLRNIWTFVVIFCGHFTKDAVIFPETVLDNDSKGHWYLRQILGSSNLSGSELFHIMTGHLSHQIEHHLFPEVPARRYREMGPKVEAVCEKYGIHYNNGSLVKQFGQVVGRIFKYALPFNQK